MHLCVSFHTWRCFSIIGYCKRIPTYWSQSFHKH